MFISNYLLNSYSEICQYGTDYCTDEFCRIRAYGWCIWPSQEVFGMDYLKTLFSAAAIFFLIVVFVALFSEDERECIKYGCDRTARSGSSYCYLHDSNTSSSSYRYNSSTRRNSYSSSSSSTRTSSSSTSSSSSSRNTQANRNTSASRTAMPDCDDYDDFDEFMDDWDGFMPDGSDAEDYWENW